jgi:hypothetical protein
MKRIGISNKKIIIKEYFEHNGKDYERICEIDNEINDGEPFTFWVCDSPDSSTYLDKMLNNNMNDDELEMRNSELEELYQQYLRMEKLERITK